MSYDGRILTMAEASLMIDFAAYLKVKASNMVHATMSEHERGCVAGMVNAAVDAELFSRGVPMPEVGEPRFWCEECGSVTHDTLVHDPAPVQMQGGVEE